MSFSVFFSTGYVGLVCIWYFPIIKFFLFIKLRQLPGLLMNNHVSSLHCSHDYVMVITSAGIISIWYANIFIAFLVV